MCEWKNIERVHEGGMYVRVRERKGFCEGYALTVAGIGVGVRGHLRVGSAGENRACVLLPL